MPTCSLGGFVSSGAEIYYTYDALSSQRSATVCSGWLVDANSSLTHPPTVPNSKAPPPGVQCVAVPPGGKWTSNPTVASPGCTVFVIRADYHKHSDTGRLVVYADDQEIARGTLDGCGVAIWTFDVL